MASVKPIGETMTGHVVDREAMKKRRDEVVGHLNRVRREIKDVAQNTKALKQLVQMEGATVVHDVGDTVANVVLAYRHLEDASMRLGKAIQAADGGVSVYDRDTTVGA
jgi:hypothetical protein